MSTLLDKIAALRAEISGLNADLEEMEYGTPEHRSVSDLIIEKQAELLKLTGEGINQQPTRGYYHHGKQPNNYETL